MILIFDKWVEKLDDYDHQPLIKDKRMLRIIGQNKITKILKTVKTDFSTSKYGGSKELLAIKYGLESKKTAK